jgi:hypothetical protein
MAMKNGFVESLVISDTETGSPLGTDHVVAPAAVPDPVPDAADPLAEAAELAAGDAAALVAAALEPAAEPELLLHADTVSAAVATTTTDASQLALVLCIPISFDLG